jgi:hypothetical protein
VGLSSKQLAERVGDMDDADVSSLDFRRSQRVVDDFACQISEVKLLAGEVAGKVTLVSAQNPDVLHRARLLQLRE